MPAAAKPKPPPPTPPRQVQSAGKQEDFHEPAAQLAEQLGWKGNPEWVTNDITVADARNYIAKVMHEHFQAAAKGLPQPDYQAACEHLAVDDPTEQSAIDEALAGAYESGKGAALQSHPITTGEMNANVDASLNLSGGR